MTLAARRPVCSARLEAGQASFTGTTTINIANKCQFLTLFPKRKKTHVNNDGLSSPYSFFNDLIIASCIVTCCFATPKPAEERAAPTAVVDLVNAAAVTTDDLGAYGEQGRMLDAVFERENCFQVRSSGGDQTVRGRSSRFVSSFR
jgi:hypothetical protein